MEEKTNEATQYQSDSGIPIKDVYTPEDIKHLDYAKDISNPGEYPFVRGIHKNMYRGRVYTKRMLMGFGTPSDTNKRLKYVAELGHTGMEVIYDMPGSMCIDSDHPLGQKEVGLVGVPINSLADMEEIFDGIPIEDFSISLQSNGQTRPVAFSQLMALADKRGIDPSTLRSHWVATLLAAIF